jgi:C4-dicarboxylate transporter DctQ subunit
MARVLNRICSVMAVLGGLLLLFITFSIAYSIVTRKLDLPTPVWVVQFNEYALLWVPFLASAWILSRNQHVSVEFLVQYLDRKGRKTLDIIHSALGMVVCGILCWYGISTTWDYYVRGVMDVASIDVPMAFVLVVVMGKDREAGKGKEDSEMGGDL